MLSFQRLDVYQRAIEFLALALEIISRLPHHTTASKKRRSSFPGRPRRGQPESIASTRAHCASLIQDRVAIETLDHFCDRIASFGQCPHLNRSKLLLIAIRQGQRRSETSPSLSPSTPRGTPTITPTRTTTTTSRDGTSGTD
jgi:hypothetical protein